MLVAVAGQRAERLEFSSGRDPFANVVSGNPAPPFDGNRDLRAPQQGHRKGGEDRVALPIEPGDQAP